MKVSIITASLNNKNTIKKSIKSVLMQEYNDVEYIVVDGASTDGTCDIITKYQDQIAHYLSESDTGLYHALNKGIALSTGDIMGVLHADDEFFSDNVIKMVVEAFETTNADMVYGNGIYFNRKHNKIIRIWNSGRCTRFKLWMGWLPLHTSVFFRRDVFERFGYYDENYKIASDTDFLISLLYVNHVKAHWVDKYFVKMQIGGLSTSNRFLFQKWKEDYHIFRKHKFVPWLMLPSKVMLKIPQLIHRQLRKQKQKNEAKQL
jgi:glycosyltransferase